MKRPLHLLNVVFSVLTLACFGSFSDASSLERIKEATQSREDQLKSGVAIKWNVTRQMSTQLLNPLDATSGKRELVSFQFSQEFSASGDAWRTEKRGQSLFQPLNGEWGLHAVAEVIWHDPENDRTCSHMSLDGGTARGQFSRQVENTATLNDLVILPVFLFSRPLRTQLYSTIISSDSPQITDDGEIIYISDEKGKVSIGFDKTKRFVPVRVKLPQVNVAIDYREFKGFGLAPSSWRWTRMTDEGEVKSATHGEVISWSRIESEAYTNRKSMFPTGISVVNADHPSVQYTAGHNGELVAATVASRPLSSWLIPANVLFILCICLAVLYRRFYSSRWRV